MISLNEIRRFWAARVAMLCVLFVVSVPIGASSVTYEQAKEYGAKVAQSVYTTDSLTFMQMCDTLYQMAVSMKHDSLMCRSVDLRTVFYSLSGNVNAFHTELEKLKDMANATGQNKVLFKSWSNFVVIHHLRRDDILGALAEIRRMQDYAMQREDYYGMGFAYCDMGLCYQYSVEQGVENLKKSVECFKKGGDRQDLFYPYCLLCQFLAVANKWDDVIEYATEVREAALGNINYVHFADIMLFRAYSNLDRREEAEQCFGRLRELMDANKLTNDNISYFAAAMVEHLCRVGELDRVPEYMEKIIHEADIHRAKLTYSKARGDYKTALELSETEAKEREEAFALYQDNQVGSANAFFNNQVLEMENAKLVARNQLIVIYCALTVAALLAIWIVYLIRVLRKLKKARAELIEVNKEILEQKEKVKASEQMKTFFIQSMSHEIRTPLNAINGFSSLLMDDSLEADERTEFQHIIQENTFMLTDILDNMLSLSDLITSTDKLEIAPTEIHTLCASVIEEMRSRDKISSDHDIDIRLDSSEECTIETNHLYLSKIIGQLVGNSLKFTREGFVAVSYNLDKQAGKLTICVTDSGIGIPADKHTWVFENCTKIDTFSPGTGVGLYLCRTILDRLGGKIFIDSSYVTGCRMVVELPA